jgi:hypothetical protein
MGIGFALPGMEGFVALIPSVTNIFGDASEQALIGVRLDGIHVVELAIEEDAPRKVELGHSRIKR